MALGTDLGIIGTGLAAGGFFLGMGWKADDLISKQARDDLAEYLRHFTAHETIKTVNLWPKVFREFFDKIFGEKHFSLKCFLRSSIASVISASICFVTIILLIEQSLLEGETNKILSDPLASGFFLLVGIVIFNLMTDYLSLLETRYVIGRIEQTNSAAKQIGWIVFDFVVTAALFMFLFFVAVSIISLLAGGEIANFGNSEMPRLFREFHELFLKFPLPNSEDAFLRVYFWTTFFTSLWVWLYFLSQLATRFVIPLSKSIHFLKYLLPIDSYPLRAVCTVMAIIACVGTWIILLPTTITG